MMRAVLARMAPAGPKGQLPILIFHRVRGVVDPLLPGEVDAAQFDRVCSWLAAWFNVIPLDVAVRRLRHDALPARSLSITFDDGYADNHDVALPILRRHGLSATFFIATGFLDGGRMWNDTIIETVRRPRGRVVELGETLGAGRRFLPIETIADKRAAIAALLPAMKYLPVDVRATAVARIAAQAAGPLPNDLMLSSAQILALRDAGMQLGAHTVSHPILALLDRAATRVEMLQSKLQLERLLEQRITLFAYPNGRPVEDYNAGCVAMARELEFEAAVTTARGTALAQSDPFQLPRLATWDRGRARFGMRLAAALFENRRGAPDQALPAVT